MKYFGVKKFKNLWKMDLKWNWNRLEMDLDLKSWSKIGWKMVKLVENGYKTGQKLL